MIRFDPLDDLEDDDADDPPTATLVLVRRRHPRSGSDPLIVRDASSPFAVMVRGEEKRALLRAAASTTAAKRSRSETLFVVALVAFVLGMLTQAMLTRTVLGQAIVAPIRHYVAGAIMR